MASKKSEISHNITIILQVYPKAKKNGLEFDG